MHLITQNLLKVNKYICAHIEHVNFYIQDHCVNCQISGVVKYFAKTTYDEFINQMQYIKKRIHGYS